MEVYAIHFSVDQEMFCQQPNAKRGISGLVTERDLGRKVCVFSFSHQIIISISVRKCNQYTYCSTRSKQILYVKSIGIDMTKRLIVIELTNAINATTPSAVSHLVYQPAKVIVDNQAICSGIASPTKAACTFTINIHNQSMCSFQSLDYPGRYRIQVLVLLRMT